LCVAALVLSLGAIPAEARIIAEHDWDDGPHGWVSEFGDVTLERETAGGNPDGWLEITFPATSEPEILESEWLEIVRVDADLLFAGNWPTNQGQSISFDFFATNETPHDLQFQFHSTNSNIWGYNVTSQATNSSGWSPVSASLSFADAWGPLPGFDDTEEQFLADLAAIDWIGVYIFREEAGEEIYGIDNFRLNVGVPEPDEFAILGAVFLASALAYRKRRRLDAHATDPPMAGAPGT